MKTLEFKLYLNTSQSAAVDRWLDVQRWVWNRGLRLLKDFEAQRHYNKHDKAYAPCCPVPWQYHWEKDDSGQWQAVRPYSEIVQFRGKKPIAPCCDLLSPVQIDRDSDYSLTPLFAHKLHPDKPWFTECPYKLAQGTIKALATAWGEYRKGKRKSPRFKRRGENRSMSDIQSGNAKIDGGYLKLPKLDKIRVRSLEKRWPTGLPVKTYHVIKEPSGYYVMLVGDVSAEAPKPTEKAAGYDAGLVHLLNDDSGHHVDMPFPLTRRLKALRRIQRKASRQQKGSANQKKTYARLAKLHEKIRRDRKSWHHKLTTFAVRKYGAIAVEKLNLVGMSKRPKPKPNEEGTGYLPNMATAKSGLNRKLRDAGIGQLFTILEGKCKAFGRRFEKVPAQFTSQTCNECGTVDSDSRRSQSNFVCVHCGHTTNADTNAARNIRDTAFPEYRGRYPALAGESKPVEPASARAVKQEGAQAPPEGDALPIPKSRRDSSGDVGSTLYSFVPTERQKRRSAQSGAAMPLQLSFWDIAPETADSFLGD